MNDRNIPDVEADCTTPITGELEIASASESAFHADLNSTVNVSPEERSARIKIEDRETAFPVWLDFFPLYFEGEEYYASLEMDEREDTLTVSRDESPFMSNPEHQLELDVTSMDLDDFEPVAMYAVAKLSERLKSE